MTDRKRQLAEAAEWHARLDDPQCPNEVYSDWLGWIESDPMNSRAFDDLARLSLRVDALRDGLRHLADLPGGNRSSDTAGSAATIETARLPGRSRSPTVDGFLKAAAVAAAAIGLTLFASSLIQDDAASRTLSYETLASQHLSAELDDGSTIRIGADTALTVSFSKDQRTVVLEKGEALFSVARDPGRPFVVVAGSGTITAVGTEFNVQRAIDRVVVTVTEGSVEVSQNSHPEGGGETGGIAEPLPSRSARLGLGEQVAYDSSGLTEIFVADPGFVTSWQQGRLQFRREPLRFVVEGVNRYSSMRIVIADSEINDLMFTGTVFDGQTEEWLRGLGQVLPLEVEYVSNDTVLLKKKVDQLRR